MSGMRDVAKLAGLSLSTVSVVLNEQSDKYVSPGCRQRVLDAAKALDYRLPPKKKLQRKTIAVILPVITSAFFPNLFSGIEDVVTSQEHTLLFCSSRFSFKKELACVETIKRQALCGIILDAVCPHEEEAEYLEMLKTEFVDKGVTIAFVEREIKHDSFYSVCVDFRHNAYLATRHLTERGHRKIAHITGRNFHKKINDRLEGYKQALGESGIPFDPGLVCAGDFTPNSGYLAMKNLMQQRSDFTALFAANDQMAIGAIKAIRYAGKAVPEDIAVVGLDNISISSMITPALTTINVPTYEMGSLAARIVLDTCAGKACRHVTQLNTDLIVRKSTDPYATNEWELVGW